MPLVYTTSLATPGSSTTSGTTNTETDAVYLKPATATPWKAIYLFAASVIGKASQASNISGIAFRIATFTTASTVGTAATPTPAQQGGTAATCSASTGGTISSTGRTNHTIFGCGKAGPGGWLAANPDAMVMVNPQTTAPSVDLLAVSVDTSLAYEFSVQHQE